MSQSGFNLRALVHQVINETDLTSPDEILGKVIEMIPRKQYPEALRQALRDHIKQEITRTNVGPIRPISPGGPSAKVAAIRESWRPVLHDRVSVGRNDWKLLADCTYDDLIYAANERFEHARQNQAKGDWFTALAEAVRLHGVDRFGNLPAPVLRDVLGGAV